MAKVAKLLCSQPGLATGLFFNIFYHLEDRLSTSQTSGANDGIRTRDSHLGKVILYQLSYIRIKSRLGPVSKTRPSRNQGGQRDSNPRIPESQSGVLTASPYPPCQKFPSACVTVYHILYRNANYCYLSLLQESNQHSSLTKRMFCH